MIDLKRYYFISTPAAIIIMYNNRWKCHNNIQWTVTYIHHIISEWYLCNGNRYPYIVLCVYLIHIYYHLPRSPSPPGFLVIVVLVQTTHAQTQSYSQPEPPQIRIHSTNMSFVISSTSTSFFPLRFRRRWILECRRKNIKEFKTILLILIFTQKIWKCLYALWKKCGMIGGGQRI